MPVRKSVIITICLGLCVALGLGLILPHLIKKNLSFSDLSEKDLSFFAELNQTESVNVVQYLEKYYMETYEMAGFVYEIDVYNIYHVYEIVHFLSRMNHSEYLSIIYQNLVYQLEMIPIHDLNGLDLYYYLVLASKAGYFVNEDDLNTALSNKYDQVHHLFYLNSIGDVLSTKLNITFLMYRDLSHEYDLTNFDLIQGFIDYYSQSNFLLPDQGKTLYNSGADILVVMSSLGLSQYIDYASAHSWFVYWMDHYKDFSFTEAFSIILYRDFLQVKSIFFDTSIDLANLDLIYSNMPASYFENTGFLTLAEIASVVTITNNEGVIHYAMGQLYSVNIDSISLFKRDYSLSNTFYGMMLAKMSGFVVDLQKISNLTDQYDIVLLETSSAENRVKIMYFLVLIRSLLDTDFEYDKGYVENELVSYVKLLTNNNNTNEVIKYLRYVTEIYSFLQIKMDYRTFHKIKEVMENLKEENGVEPAFANFDKYIVNHLLELNTFSESDFLADINCFSISNGFRMNIYTEEPDLYTTFSIYRIIDDIYSLSNFDFERREFILNLMDIPGIYADIEHGTISLQSIYYGNIIKYARW